MESRNDRGDRKTTICPRSTYRRLLSWVPTRLSRCLGALGEFVVRRPFLVIGASILAVLICAIGWIRFDVLSDPGTLWVPRGSSTLKHQNFVEENYSGIDRAYQVYVHATGNIANSTEGALTVESLRDVFSLDKKLKEIEVKGLGKWPKVCDTLVTGFCTESGITRFWTWSSDSFEASVAGDRAKLLRDVNQPTYPDGGQASKY
ncbi:hypothetical protein BSKO_03111 [Bryopsis sp. KO-2023]|nr:hypothetical protein BSKO_03111 [Bryopsis sp. KO-2023]